MATKGQKFKKIPFETKLEAIKERQEKKVELSIFSSKYGVSKDIIKTWVRIYLRDEV